MRGVFITQVAAPAAGDMRLAVKDLFDTEGVRTTYGSAIFGDHVPAATGSAVTRLTDAGYVTVGKANLHEFAYGITSDNDFYGLVPNPIAPGHYAGGSSGGNAAALVAGLADAAIGTDSGGSIRIPSACCGTTGFKPTYGLVPLDGCFPLAPSFDHAGPMARDVGGCVAMMGALVPGFSVPAVTLADLRIGVAWIGLADPGVAAAVSRAVEALPVAAEFVSLPLSFGTSPLFGREVAEVHGSLWEAHRSEYGANVAYKLGIAMQTTDAEVVEAERIRASYRDEMASLMAPFDLVLTPTLAMVAPLSSIPELSLRDDILQFTYPFNATGAPALAMPCGTGEDGLPASLQVVGAPGADALVLGAGLALEAITCAGPA